MSRAITREEEGPMTDQKKVQEQGTQKISRRNVLKAAMAAGGAAALGFPNIVKAQGVTTMRWQSTWPSKDIFHEYALDYAKKVNDMTGANVVSFPYGPMPTQPLGWYKKVVTKPDDFKGMKFRTVGISIDLFTGMGAAVNALPGAEIVPALDRGLIDAAEFNNASSDRAL